MKSTTMAAHYLALKLQNVLKPRVGTQGTNSSAFGGGTPGTSFSTLFSALPAHLSPETRPGPTGASRDASREREETSHILG